MWNRAPAESSKKLGICCLHAKPIALMSKVTQDNVSEWSDMSTCGLFFSEWRVGPSETILKVNQAKTIPVKFC